MTNVSIKNNLANWNKTKELYTDWVSKTELNKFFGDHCSFDGFSTWWITNICNKDNTVNYKWYYKLKFFLIDKKKIQYNQFFFLVIFFIKFTKNFVVEILFNILLKIISTTRKLNLKKKNCFYVNINALKKFKNNYVDEIYGVAPIKKNIKDNFYLIEITKRIKFVINYRNFKQKLDKMKIPYILSNEFITLIEIINIYLKTFYFFIKTFIYLKKKNDLFIIKGKNCKNILEPLLLSSFSGEIQYSLIQALAIRNFFKKKNSENFFSYVEFNPLSRSIYFFLKKSNQNIKSIAYQHSYCNENVLPFYHRPNEFTSKTKDEGKKFSPSPDLYLVQGKKNKKLFSKYFKKKIFIIGSLRYDIKNFKKFKKKKNLNKKVLVCPSVGDQDMIIDYINSLKYRKYQFILSPHPSQKLKTIRIFKKKLSKDINLEISNQTTDQNLPLADIVLCGHSSVAFEAMIQNKLSARVINSKHQPGYDTNDGVQLAYPSIELKEIISNKMRNKKEKIKDYFYKLDKKSYLRFWKVISKL